MPTAMSYAIDTLLRLCEENTRLRMRLGEPPREVENIQLEVGQKVCDCHTLEEVERLKESADLIAESQQKQINLLLEDQRERMEDRERLVKENDFLKQQLTDLTSAFLETKIQLKAAEEKVERAVGGNVGRPKKLVCSPCISDPTP